MWHEDTPQGVGKGTQVGGCTFQNTYAFDPHWAEGSLSVLDS